MELLMEVATVFAVANTSILLVLIFLYMKIAQRTKAMYSVGLGVFSVLLLMHNLLTIFAYVTMSPLFGSEALPFLAAMGALEFGGLAVLLKLTL
jgi:hypothetical protein